VNIYHGENALPMLKNNYDIYFLLIIKILKLYLSSILSSAVKTYTRITIIVIFLPIMQCETYFFAVYVRKKKPSALNSKAESFLIINQNI